jgi:hypothetical protein
MAIGLDEFAQGADQESQCNIGDLFGQTSGVLVTMMLWSRALAST